MAMIEKAMYLKGLCDGVELDKTTKEGKLIAALLDMVVEMATEMDEMQTRITDLEDYCEELDSDLGDVEEVLLDMDEDDDDDFAFDGCDGDCASCDFDCMFDDEDEDEDDEDILQVECPSCGDVIHFPATIDPENLTCPGCNAKLACIVSEEDFIALDDEADGENDD